MATHNDIGKMGEQLATDLLTQKGHTILARNWRHSRHEVDLISRDGAFVVFTEVKTRSTAAFGKPDEFLSEAQKKRLIAAANAFLEQHNLMDEARFDVVSVTLSDSGPRLFHIRDAFYAAPFG